MARSVNRKVAEKAKQKENKDLGGLFIPAGLFLGMGLGFIIDKLVAGLFIGLGAGFLLFAIVNLFKKK